MAKAVSKTNASLIAMLAKSRAEIYKRAHRENGRDLSVLEQTRIDALDWTIANAAPTSRSEAALQIAIASDAIEVICDDGTAPLALELANAALQAASAFLGNARFQNQTA